MKQLFKVVKGHGGSKEAVEGKTFEKKADAKKLRDKYMEQFVAPPKEEGGSDLSRQQRYSHPGAYRVVPAKDHHNYQEKK